MRNTVRKFLGAAILGLLGAVVIAPAIAGAQTTVPGEGGVEPPSPGACVINDITPDSIPEGGSALTVSGTAPAGVELFIYYNEVIGTDGKPTDSGASPVATVVVPSSGAFSVVTPSVTTATDVSANYTFGNKNFYATGCANIAGQVVVRVEVEGTSVSRGALAFTGSSQTPTYLLVGLAAIVVGVVFVVAARRRSRTHG